MKTNTAVVVGATGLIGKELVEQLSAQTHIEKVVAISRRPVKYSSPKIANVVVDFDRLKDFAEFIRGDYLFSALGTTLQQAGSKEAQWKIDHDYQLAAAEIAAKNGIPHYLLVSSASAKAGSGNFYLGMKGELEANVKKLPFKRISIFQPSLLLGRTEKTRTGEEIGAVIMPVLKYIPGLSKYRPIKGSEVAQRMIEVSQSSGSGVETFSLDQVFPKG